MLYISTRRSGPCLVKVQPRLSADNGATWVQLRKKERKNPAGGRMYSHISFIGLPVHPLSTLGCSTSGSVCAFLCAVWVFYAWLFVAVWSSSARLNFWRGAAFMSPRILSFFSPGWGKHANDLDLKERKRGQRQEESWVNLPSESQGDWLLEKSRQLSHPLRDYHRLYITSARMPE